MISMCGEQIDMVIKNEVQNYLALHNDVRIINDYDDDDSRSIYFSDGTCIIADVLGTITFM